MAEQRLIDANELYGVESLLNTDIVKNSKEASYIISQVLHDIQTIPTIDPEDLPIARQLREELVRVTAERDAAVECIASKCRHIEDTERGPYCVLNGEPCYRCEDVWRAQQEKM